MVVIIKQMKTFRSLTLFSWVFTLSLCFPAKAQVYTNGIVGYINEVLFAGDNLIANQLGNSDNTLNVIFNVGVPDGSTFTLWDATQMQFLPASHYDANTGWSINYHLDYGQGGRFHAAATFTNTFVGNVWPGFGGQIPFTPPLVSNNGRYLLSCYVPLGGASFNEIVGRNPLDGESVRTLNALTQAYSTTTFENGSWDHGAPGLSVGEAAFFNLGPTFAAVPEPAVLYLAGFGVVACAAGRRSRG